MDTAARQMGAFWQLRELIYEVASQTEHRGRNQATPDETRIANAYYAAYSYASQPYLYIQNSPSHPDKPKWHKMHAFYETDPGFFDEVLKRFCSPAFRTAVYKATGRLRPGDPPPVVWSSAPAPSGAEAYLAQGYKYLDANEYAKALEAFQKAIALKPSASDACLSLGFCYYQLKQYQNALPAFQQAVRLKPNDNANHFWAGVTYYNLEQYPKALAELQESVRLKPKDSDNHYWIGEIQANDCINTRRLCLLFARHYASSLMIRTPPKEWVLPIYISTNIQMRQRLFSGPFVWNPAMSTPIGFLALPTSQWARKKMRSSLQSAPKTRCGVAGTGALREDQKMKSGHKRNSRITTKPRERASFVFLRV
jgi:tetratricopeptide (TPR) repeat protein